MFPGSRSGRALRARLGNESRRIVTVEFLLSIVDRTTVPVRVSLPTAYVCNTAVKHPLQANLHTNAFQAENTSLRAVRFVRRRRWEGRRQEICGGLSVSLS